MNALVNDQLGRLRMLLGDPRVTTQFQASAGRPPRFARYTSRTLYPGVRSRKKDQLRLKPIEDFYILLLDQAGDESSPGHDQRGGADRHAESPGQVAGQARPAGVVRGEECPLAERGRGFHPGGHCSRRTRSS